MKIDIGGCRLYVEERGAGKPLILIHGFPLVSGMWSAQLAALSSFARVIAYDLRGYGSSDATDGISTMDLMADDLAHLMDRLSIPSATICGFSMGGYIALAFAESHPERLDGIILVDTKATADTEAARAARNALIERAQKGDLESFPAENAARLLSPTTVAGRPGIVRLAHDLARGVTPATLISSSRGMLERPDRTPMLGSIAVPTLVIVGEDDVITPPADARSMADRIRNVRLKLVASAGHLTPVEQPDEVNAAITEFLTTSR